MPSQKRKCSPTGASRTRAQVGQFQCKAMGPSPGDDQPTAGRVKSKVERSAGAGLGGGGHEQRDSAPAGTWGEARTAPGRPVSTMPRSGQEVGCEQTPRQKAAQTSRAAASQRLGLRTLPKAEPKEVYRGCWVLSPGVGFGHLFFPGGGVRPRDQGIQALTPHPLHPVRGEESAPSPPPPVHCLRGGPREGKAGCRGHLGTPAAA